MSPEEEEALRAQMQATRGGSQNPQSYMDRLKTMAKSLADYLERDRLEEKQKREAEGKTMQIVMPGAEWGRGVGQRIADRVAPQAPEQEDSIDVSEDAINNDDYPRPVGARWLPPGKTREVQTAAYNLSKGAQPALLRTGERVGAIGVDRGQPDDGRFMSVQSTDMEDTEAVRMREDDRAFYEQMAALQAQKLAQRGSGRN